MGPGRERLGRAGLVQTWDARAQKAALEPCTCTGKTRTRMMNFKRLEQSNAKETVTASDATVTLNHQIFSQTYTKLKALKPHARCGKVPVDAAQNVDAVTVIY